MSNQLLLLILINLILLTIQITVTNILFLFILSVGLLKLYKRMYSKNQHDQIRIHKIAQYQFFMIYIPQIPRLLPDFTMLHRSGLSCSLYIVLMKVVFSYLPAQYFILLVVDVILVWQLIKAKRGDDQFQFKKSLHIKRIESILIDPPNQASNNQTSSRIGLFEIGA